MENLVFKITCICLFLQVSPNSIAGHAGLKAGDAILRIGSSDVVGFTHEQARGEMLRCGNDVCLTVQRFVVLKTC